jgi:hypothetical protein
VTAYPTYTCETIGCRSAAIHLVLAALGRVPLRLCTPCWERWDAMFGRRGA